MCHYHECHVEEKKEELDERKRQKEVIQYRINVAIDELARFNGDKTETTFQQVLTKLKEAKMWANEL